MHAIELGRDTTLEILKALRHETSGEAIARKLGISRTSVWKSIEKLRSIGYRIDARRKIGYRIISSPDLSAYAVAEACIKTGFEEFIKEVHYYTEVDSTNQRAKEEMREKLLIVAEKQSRGRGRLGREWLSDEGGLYFTITLSPGISIEDVPKLTLTTGVAVCSALSFVNARLKWPNDVLVDGKKVCGILSELGGETDSVLVIVGIGINVNNTVELENAISLKEIKGELRRDELLEDVLFNLSKYYKMFLNNKWDKIRQKWKELSDMLGKEVIVRLKDREYRGVAVDLDTDGGLLLKVDDRIERIYSGDCFYV